VRLNDMTIQKLPKPQSGQKLYGDDTLPGFGVRVSFGGSKTFVLTVGTERQRVTIGRYPIVTLAQAREKARTILAERQLGIFPKPSPTFGVVREEYLAQRDDRVRAATRQADKYLFKPFVTLSQKKTADIEATDIERILDAMDAPTTRRHAFIRLQGLFRYAVRRGYLEHSPMERLDCLPQPDARERVLSDTELRQVIEAARLYGYPYGTIVQLCAMLGQRRQQIGAMRAHFVDFEKMTITWPPELMKTGRRHTIPFGLTTKGILEGIAPNQEGLYFASRVNSPFVGWSYHKARFDRECKVTDFRLHDLRRTLATRWQEVGIEIAATEKYLSHSAVTGGLIGIYQRSAYLEQMRAAALLWEAKLQALLSDAKIADRAA
jgi:integrase